MAPSADRMYNGMAIELKADNVRVKTRSGAYVADEHIRAQAKCHEQLREEGYWADFIIGYDAATEQIDRYFGQSQAELF